MAGKSVEVSLNGKGTYNFREIIDGISEEMPEVRRAVLEDVGGMLEEELDKAISSSDLSATAKTSVRSWQELHYGKTAYVAMRPSSAPYKDRVWKRTPVTNKQVTRWLEHGHGTRPQSETMMQSLARRMRGGKASRTGEGFVTAKPFYWFAQRNAKKRAKAVAETALARELKKRL